MAGLDYFEFEVFRNLEGCYVVDSLDLLEEAVTSVDLAEA